MNQTTKSLSLLIYFAICVQPNVHAQEITEAHKDSLTHIVTQYYKLSLQVYQQNSTRSDIDKLFGLFTDDFEYVHPKYGGTYSRTDIYEGYVNNQENGAYNGTTVDIKVRNMIIGLNAVATDRVYLNKDHAGALVELDPGMTVFEFSDGKISRIFEYW